MGEEMSKDAVLRLRSKYFSKSLSVSYANTDPLMIMKGRGSKLYDENDVEYLDTRNNVAHVGHSHPVVVKAIQEQCAQLNTNTRYLHPSMSLLGEKLISLFSDELEVVFFCNSGSEANDLALRLARAHSRSSNTIVVDRAYHGHTLSTLEISPYKYELEEAELSDSEIVSPMAPFRSPGRHIWQVPCPDTYRGLYRDEKSAGVEYAEHVEEACKYYSSKGEKVRAMLVEGGLSVAGVILPPPNYMRRCAAAVRKAGGLYISDEVQTGFGRMGSYYWAFEQSGVTPDIVTIGKPFGNGMPLAGVVTTRTIATAFEECGVEYFNTFAGNPVCARAGLAMLQVLEDENLQANAREIGDHLKEGFLRLQSRIDLIGDVRGQGLFLGVELVRNRTTLEPATQETSFICSVLKSRFHILTSIDGPFSNVLVIKPPLCFSKEDADYFLDSFEKAVHEMEQTDSIDALEHTPT